MSLPWLLTCAAAVVALLVYVYHSELARLFWRIVDHAFEWCDGVDSSAEQLRKGVSERWRLRRCRRGIHVVFKLPGDDDRVRTCVECGKSFLDGKPFTEGKRR